MPRPALTLGAVVVGGMVGSGIRAVVALPVTGPITAPLTILVVNLVGSFALGALVARIGQTRPLLRAFVGTGVLGGFTTYSGFAVQVLDLGGAAPVLGVLLAAATILGGVLAAGLGLAVGRGRGRTAPTVSEAP